MVLVGSPVIQSRIPCPHLQGQKVFYIIIILRGLIHNYTQGLIHNNYTEGAHT